MSASVIMDSMVMDAAKFTKAVKSSYWYPDGETQFKGDSATGDSSEACRDDNSTAHRIDSTLFTHLLCAYADLDSKTYEVDISKNYHNFSTFTKIVRERNDKVRTLLSIGGPENTTSISYMAKNSTSRKNFINSSIKIARDNHFNGLDLAWVYPSSKVDMTNLEILLHEWRQAIIAEAEQNTLAPLLLTAAVYYSPIYKSFAYPIDSIVENLDWVNIIAYNFYEPSWSELTGPPAALKDNSNAGLNIKAGLKQWFEDKLPKDMAVLGLPYIGWAWTLENEKHHGYHAAATGAAISPDGSMNYDQVKKFTLTEGAAVMHDPNVTGDYCYAGKTWIAYDDNQSIVHKVRYAKESSLRGYFSFHIGADIDCGLSRTSSRIWESTDVWDATEGINVVDE
ncbi:unnamed protein product [Cochlearia groenlandica]